MDFLVRETSISMNVYFDVEYEETKTVRFHEACSSELNEKLNVLKFSESMKIMKIVLMNQNAVQ